MKVDRINNNIVCLTADENMILFNKSLNTHAETVYTVDNNINDWEEIEYGGHNTEITE